MAKFVFIHGKNPELSVAEIMALSGSRPIEAGTRFSVFNVVQDFDHDRLGSSIKSARVLDELPKSAGQQEVMDAVEKAYPALVRGLRGRSVAFALSIYGRLEGREAIEHALKRILRSEGMKASSLKPDGDEVGHADITRKRVIDNGFELVIARGRSTYLAKTEFVHDPFDFRKRDIGRPVQRPIFSIPPRLARTMVNLSGARRGDVFLDPFCGMGSIIQEAVLMGMRISGIDSAGSVASGARKNLEWLEREYRVRVSGSVMEGDARQLSRMFSFKSIDAMATEPHMGPPLRHRPDRLRAIRILEKLRPLYEHALKEMLAVLKPGHRICMVSPAFLVRGRFYGINIAEIAGSAGGKIIDPLHGSGMPHSRPLRDFGERHRTIREIYLMERVD